MCRAVVSRLSEYGCIIRPPTRCIDVIVTTGVTTSNIVTRFVELRVDRHVGGFF